ncbi:MAG TPA: DUF2080 family transposase-associated protein [Nanoarchaeota archaeon]|nr:DUF2080 family transposase-associated protein [Nanoarchaeota archaeon]HIH63791.1 DUF2080 family transposase-associated protein [Nanoarchaeota archaeon]HIJ09664.1 DUF2080 family transposase-associated protein [Nanoarchaeota archaeon]HLD55646.1 DUF2080 family transposase-associated protein [Candidatus Nanoarchaeia archaeon]
MNKENINSLVKNIDSINQTLRLLNVPEKVIEKKITSFGNGAHVILSKKYLNKTVKVVIE